MTDETDGADEYVERLVEIGFTETQAQTIAEGRDVDAVTEEELLQFAYAWENDLVEPMKPLVEKYGWDGLTRRLVQSVADHDVEDEPTLEGHTMYPNAVSRTWHEVLKPSLFDRS